VGILIQKILADNRIYYGWAIVFVMAVSSAVSMGMGSLNFGLYIKPMGEDLSIGRAAFGWASTARGASGAVTGPIIGRLLDRFGARWLLSVTVIVTGVCMIGLANAQTEWHLIFAFAVMGLVGMNGPGSLVTSVPITKWFIRDRGKALAFSAVGISAGAVVFVPLTQIFIDLYDWQGAWIILAVIGMSVVTPLSIFFVRKEPEDMGLVPDGIVEEPDHSIGENPSHEYSWTLSQALRTPSMWTLTLAFSLLSLAILTLALHRIPAFMDRGLDASLVSIATAFDAVCAGLASFGAGMLVKRVQSKIIGTMGFLFLALASVMTIYAHDFWLMFWSMALFGLGIGTNMFTQSYIWAEYFGREHLGSIRGFVMPINLFIGGLGAPAAGYVLDQTGSYDPAWWSGVILMLIAATVFALSRRPGRPTAKIDQL